MDKNPDEAFRLFRLAADKGHVEAEFRVGEMREKGWGAAPSFADAQRWYEMSAKGGDPEAANGLAQLYEEGYGVDKDLKRAAQWYKQAAEQGFADAEFRLAYLTEHGQGVPKDEMEAVKWYFAAANQGYAQAQARVGALYLEGKGGVMLDNQKAYFWLTLATKQNNRDAERQRNELIKKLTKDDITKLEVQAAGWKSQRLTPRNPNIVQ